MAANARLPRTRSLALECARQWGLGAGLLAFVAVASVALVSGVAAEAAATRGLVAAGVLGGIAAAGGFVLNSAVAATAAAPSNRRGQLLDVTLPHEGDG